MRWLAEGTVAALAGALREVAPDLTGYPIVMTGRVGASVDPRWRASSAFIGEEFVAKFAWSRPAALQVRNEIGVLTALSSVVPYLPEVVVGSLDPLLLVTRRVAGTSLFEVADSIDRNQAGRQLARFLAHRRPPDRARLGRRPGGPLRRPRPRPLAALAQAWRIDVPWTLMLTAARGDAAGPLTTAPLLMLKRLP